VEHQDPRPRRLSPGGARLNAFAWFAAGIAAWFGAWGIQMVVFSWLVVGTLHASAEWVGVAQTSTMLPALFLVLFGGAVADRVDPRRLVVVLHAVAVIPVALLALAVATDRLSLLGLGVYGVAIGTVSAFSMPARDALLSRVAGQDLMRAVTSMTAAQFGAQSAGNLLAGSARWWGPVPAIALQALLLLAGALVLLRVPALAPPPRPAERPSALREIGEALRIVAREPRLRTPLLLVLAVGFFFIGPFTVAVPLLVRDFYAGGAAEISLVVMLFPLGTITGSLWLRSRGLRRKGRAALLALGVGCGALASMGLGLPFPALMAATFCWGLGGAVFINASRTLYQAAAPEGQRARVLAAYQLGFLGGAPLGSICAGLLGAALGIQDALLWFAGGMLLAVISVWLGTGMARME
jgi:MFS family permease